MRAPTPRAGWVTRERLFTRLDELRQARVAVIAAPPGYGKTTLLAGWLAHAAQQDPSFHAAWLGLGAGENDPVRFWSYAAGAIQLALEPVLGDAAPGRGFLDLIRSPQPPLENALTGLLNDLAAFDGTLCLALDDYQVIDNEAIHAGLRFLIENQPDSLRLVIASRSDPPPALARYRVRGWLVELRAADLRFTEEEAADFLRGSMRLDLGGEEVRALEQRTEGWAAALQLAALALRLGDTGPHSPAPRDPRALIESFSGDDRYLLDYLTEEVLSHLPESVQSFLLRTSVLDRFCLSLVEAVTSDELVEKVTSEELLSQRGKEVSSSSLITHNSLTSNFLAFIEHNNLFLIPLDSRRGWYRYHALFASALRDRLRQVAPDLAPVLHRRAMGWFARQEMFEDAIWHAFAAGDLGTAADLMGRLLMTLIQAGEGQTLNTLLKGFPLQFVRTRPELCLGYGWLALLYADFAGAAEWVSAAERALQPGDRTVYQTHIDLVRSTVAINQKNFERAIQLARRALPFLPADAHLMLTMVHLNLGDAYHSQGAFEEAAQAYRRGLEEARASHSSMMQVVIIGGLGNLYLNRGLLRQSEQSLALTSEIEKSAGGEVVAAGKPLSFLSTVYLEWNDLERAEATARRAVALCEKWGHTEHAFDSNLRLAQILQVRGDQAGAQSVVERAMDWIERVENNPTLPAEIRQGVAHNYRRRAELVVALMACQRQDVEGVRRWLERQGALDAGKTLGYRTTALLAWYWLTLGSLERARGVLDGLLARMEAQPEEQRSLWQWINVLTLLAALHDADGDREQALATLERALALAEPEGYTRIFLDQGAAIEELLKALAQRETVVEGRAVRRLLRAFAQAHDQGAPAGAADLAAGREAAGAGLAAARAAGLGTAGLSGMAGEKSGSDELDGPLEALSEREMEILRLLAADQTYPEIATTLYLSVNTVKTHVKRLYAKLGVDSRMAAVDAARRWGLLAR